MRAARYLAVPVWDLVERVEAGETLWLHWARTAEWAETKAEQDVQNRSSKG